MVGTARHIVVDLAELLQAQDMDTFMHLSNLVASGQITIAVQYMGYTATPVVRVSDGGTAAWTLTMATSLTQLSVLEVHCDDITFTYYAKDFDFSSLAIN
jgi:hypothetical protein